MGGLIEKLKENRLRIAEASSIFGLISSVAAFFVPPEWSDYLKIAVAVCFAVTILFIVAKRADRSPDPPDDEPKYSITIPADPADLEGAIALARQEFGSNTISPSVVRESFARNPYCIAIAKDSSGSVVGFLDYYALTEAAMKRIEAGTIKESEFTVDHLAAAAEIKNVESVYVGGIYVAIDSKGDRSRVVIGLLIAIVKVIRSEMIGNKRQVNIYAAAYGTRGLPLLNKAGFVRVNEAHKRSDASDLYLKIATTSNLRQATRFLPPKSSSVKIKYTKSRQ
ncbi:hypothetical protein NOJ28_11155 [Neorhizobium galegae]|uniref:hypothetical protein n=1 Tax=Neorhizobium galegae TaxID=399 RepID=UPI000622796A|nr:hypothetical protein [Neorhizobium galegae]MCQ1766093.1 hypothetical protein [Neorhizobium galegae]MCQ1845007.1 hypothetical protein [Neorhizobium galegae]CDZ40335.1 Hypothetical protein NGAL_HAMBI1146_38160 [Neorhizobium galegae bv. officinalis]